MSNRRRPPSRNGASSIRSNSDPESATLNHGNAGQTKLLLTETSESSSKRRLRVESSARAATELRRGLHSSSCQPTAFIHVRLAPAKPTPVFDTYWRFASERQAVFFRRLRGDIPPWTDDAILRKYKFTNAYRASDRVSQYLIRNIIYRVDVPARDLFFRIVLFKIFNRVDTWRLLQDAFGEVAWSTYKFDAYDRVLTEAIERGRRIYSAAYIMPSGGNAIREQRKHRMHLRLVESMLAANVPERLATMKRMHDAFDLLRSYPTIGDFLAYQYVTDLNYSTLTSFSETEFVVPGPGARDGIRKCFSSLGGLTESDIIRFVCDRQEEEFARLGIQFQSLWGRPLQYIDCQNLFCEVDKYARVFHPEASGLSGRTRIKQQFKPLHEPLSCWYPPKWNINQRVIDEVPCQPSTSAEPNLL